LGEGNSKFTQELFEAGYTNITNIDISAVVISQMQQRYAHLEGAECKISRTARCLVVSVPWSCL